MTELSVIIPTRDRLDLLRAALVSIMHQSLDLSRFEVIVVDNSSTGSAGKTVELIGAEHSCRIRYFHETKPGLHNGRHRGAKEATGEILVFADDDIQAFPSWLEAIKESFLNPQVALVGGKNLPDFETDPPGWFEKLWEPTRWGRNLGYYSLLDFGDSVCEIPPVFVWGCNFSIRREVLDSVGGFHPDGMPENLLRYRGDGETAVSMAVSLSGYKAVYNPRASVYHYVPKSRMTYEYLYKRSFAQGISDSFMAIRRFGGYIFFARLMLSAGTMKNSLRLIIRGDWAFEPRKAIRRGYRDGIAFHMSEVKKDPLLLQWVMKKDFRE